MIHANSAIRTTAFALFALAVTGNGAGAATLRPDADAIYRSAVGTAPAERGIAAYPVARRGGVRDLGRYAWNAPVRLGIVLRYQHEAELAQLTYLQGERGSRYYHRYLSNAQWNAYFAPSEAVVIRTATELERRGLHVKRILPNRTMIDVVGPSGAAERIFGTEIHRIYQAERHGYGYANVRPATMPAFLRGVAVSVAGLHSNDVAFYPASVAHLGTRRHDQIVGVAPRPNLSSPSPSPSPTPTPRPITTSTPAPNPHPDTPLPTGPTDIRSTNMGGYGPAAYAVAYDLPDLHGYAGHGANVGNVISGDFCDSDLAAQQAEFGITHTGTTNRVVVDSFYVQCVSANFSTGDVGESSLDVQTILGLAPAANFYEYLINTLADLGIEDGYNRVVNDNIVGTVNSSFGGCETDDPSFEFATNYIAMQGAAKGIGFNASTGDTGGNGCNGVTNGAPGSIKGVEAPSVDYYFTGVGGTDLVVNPATGARIGETGWETGGGGVSAIEALPAWQSSVVSGGVNPVLTGRNTPDVAFDAALETGYETVVGGSDGLTGGTSLASPIFCATQTMIDQIQGSRNGWVNPRLYQIVAAQGYGFAFTDVVAGQNQDYVAGPGYDNVTGIGTINGWELAGTE